METKQNNQKANRILYISVIAVLCAAAIIVAVAVAANRSDSGAPSGTTGRTEAPSTTVPNPGTQAPGGDDPAVNELTFVSPAVGSVLRDHSPDVLVFSPTMNDHRAHLGIDIATSEGAEVYATADGVVKDIGYDPLMGQFISIEHEGGFVSYYRNLSQTLPEGIELGAAVKGGDVIGAVGETAMIEVADEPHLHFELKLDGKQVDPMTWISEESRSASLSGSGDLYEG